MITADAANTVCAAARPCIAGLPPSCYYATDSAARRHATVETHRLTNHCCANSPSFAALRLTWHSSARLARCCSITDYTCETNWIGSLRISDGKRCTSAQLMCHPRSCSKHGAASYSTSDRRQSDDGLYLRQSCYSKDSAHCLGSG